MLVVEEGDTQKIDNLDNDVLGKQTRKGNKK
jgi:hypothetical protein